MRAFGTAIDGDDDPSICLSNGHDPFCRVAGERNLCKLVDSLELHADRNCRDIAAALDWETQQGCIAEWELASPSASDAVREVLPLHWLEDVCSSQVAVGHPVDENLNSQAPCVRPLLCLKGIHNEP